MIAEKAIVGIEKNISEFYQGFVSDYKLNNTDGLGLLMFGKYYFEGIENNEKKRIESKISRNSNLYCFARALGINLYPLKAKQMESEAKILKESLSSEIERCETKSKEARLSGNDQLGSYLEARSSMCCLVEDRVDNASKMIKNYLERNKKENIVPVIQLYDLFQKVCCTNNYNSS